MRRGLRSVLFGLALVTAGSTGRADDAAEAARLFQEGTTAYAARDFARAAELFEAAHRAAPRAATSYSAGLAREAAGQRARAADAFETALALGGLEDRQAADVRTRLAALNRVVGTLSVTEPVGGSVSAAHVQRAPVPSRIHVEPGAIDVVVERPDGSRETRRVDVPAGETVTVAVAATTPRAPAAPSSPGAPAAPPARAASNADGASGGSLRTLGWIGLGLGVAAGGAAAGLGAATLGARDDYAATGYTDAAARDETIALRTWTNVALAGAVAFGVAGVVLLVVGPSSKPRAAHLGALQF